MSLVEIKWPLMEQYKRSFRGENDSLEIQVLTRASGGQKVHVDKLTGLVFAKERNRAEETARQWSEEVYKGKASVGTSYTGMIPIMKARHHFVAETLEQILPGGLTNKRICDVGAGEGYFLNLIKRDYGASVVGVEPSRENCERLSRQGIPNYQGTAERFLKSHQELKESFDIVTLNWTLCNCSSCCDVIDAAKELVREGGYVLVCDSSRILTPFKKSLSLWMQPNVAVHLHPWFFSFNTIRCLMATFGLDPVFQNNHHEQNDLLTIGQKKRGLELHPEEYFDNYRDVISFFERWEKESENYRTFDRGGYDKHVG